MKEETRDEIERMDLNLNLGPPLCPPPLSVDLGYDPALDALPVPSSDIDDVFMRLPPIDALFPFDEIPDPENLFEPFDLPPYNDFPPTEERRVNALNSTPYSESLILDNEPLARTGGPTLRRELLESPEYRFQRLFESRERLEMARTRSNQDDSSARSATDPERLMRDIRRSGRLVGPIGKHKPTDKAPQAEGSTEEKKEKSGSASDFDCNICFEVAKEPVVTCCGHLFCWPCLYQWLHVHCDYKECPVCKGRVSESCVVPIYGRGSSEASGEKKDGEAEHQGLKIPPRPQGSRVESLRQQLQNPTFRSSDFIQEVHQLFNLPSIRFLQRVDRRNLQPQPSSTEVPIVPPVIVTSPPQDETASQRHNLLQSANPVAILAGLRSSAQIREQPVMITVSDDLPDPAPSPSQASTSSTMARIEGEGFPSDASVEPRRGGTSMVLRRRTTRNRAWNSSDASGRARQRRRIN